MLAWRKINNDISLNDIADAEKVLGVIFPTELQKLILHFNHGRPDKFISEKYFNKNSFILDVGFEKGEFLSYLSAGGYAVDRKSVV